MRILLTRPREDSRTLGERLQRQGHQVVQAPLLEIRRLPEAVLELDGVQALLLTSANGARALPAGAAPRSLPVFAVGARTAAAAREAGFDEVFSADGDVSGLARLVRERLDPAAGTLLHVTARHRAGDLAGRLGEAGFRVRRAILYEATTVDVLPAAAAAALQQGVDAVLFYSPRTALTFAKLTAEAGLGATCCGTAALCLSGAVADAARGLEWRAVHVARQPDEEALLQLLDQVETGK